MRRIFKEKIIMKPNMKLTPQQSAPVNRGKVGEKADLLAELSEESLSGVVASATIECIRVCFCAASGTDK
jgi:bacteriocin leader peptide (microcyclamide/patellamide family)